MVKNQILFVQMHQNRREKTGKVLCMNRRKKEKLTIEMLAGIW
jgi:hypothetical protein